MVNALSVDFGTSHTVAVLRRDDGVTPLLFDGSPLLPSAVFVDSAGTVRTGRDAVNMSRMDPVRFEPNPKRRVDDGFVLLGDNELPVHRVFAAVLERVRDECVRVAGGLPERVVLTHPATWGPSRRLVLTDAAAAAGFPALELISEPVAAATYFTEIYRARVAVGTAVVVYDFGGGTFDVSVVGRGPDGFQVWAEDGAGDLGGVDLDHALVGHLRARHGDEAEWNRLLDATTVESRRGRAQLYADVRAGKEQLSRHANVDLLVPVLNLDVHLTRDELDEVTGPLLDKAVRLTQAVIRATGLTDDRIAGVFLVGGASRMPLAATKLHRAIGIAPTVIDQPETVVANGALAGLPRTDTGPVPAAAGMPPYQPSAPVSPPFTGPPPIAPPPTGARPAVPGPSGYGLPQADWPPGGAAPVAPRKPLAARIAIWIQFGLGFPLLGMMVVSTFESVPNHSVGGSLLLQLGFTVVPFVLVSVAAGSAVAMSRPRPVARGCAVISVSGLLVMAFLSLFLRIVTVASGGIMIFLVALSPFAMWALIALNLRGVRAWFRSGVPNPDSHPVAGR